MIYKNLFKDKRIVELLLDCRSPYLNFSSLYIDKNQFRNYLYIKNKKYNTYLICG